MVFLDLETVVPYCFIREERGVLPLEGFFTFTLGLRIFTFFIMLFRHGIVTFHDRFFSIFGVEGKITSRGAFHVLSRGFYGGFTFYRGLAYRFLY